MKPFRLQILVITLVRIVLNTTQRMVYPFLTVFWRGLGVYLSLLSQAIATRFVVGAAGPFLASVADSRGRKLGILLGLSIYILGASLVVLWPVYPMFVLTLALTLFGKYIFDPSMQAYIGERVAYRQRGMILAFTEFAWSLSFMLGVPFMGFLIVRLGWLSPFPAALLCGLVGLGGLAWLLPRDPKPPQDQPGLGRNLLAVLAYPPALVGLGMGFLLSGANEVVNLIFGVWMENSFGLKIAALGVASAVIGFSELGGESLTAALVDRLGKSRAVALGLVANCLAALVLPIFGRSLPGAFAGLFLFYLTFEFTVVSSIPLMSEIVPSARATLMATNGASHALGRAMSDLIAPSVFALGFWSSCLAAVVFNLLALWALSRLRKTVDEREKPLQSLQI